jgi:hypothetical protein
MKFNCTNRIAGLLPPPDSFRYRLMRAEAETLEDLLRDARRELDIANETLRTIRGKEGR